MPDRYTNRVRVRTGAFIPLESSLLLVSLHSPVRSAPVWTPPGGEVMPGEALEEALVREVEEETGLRVHPQRLSLIHEFIVPPLHAVEHYFTCSITGGTLQLGVDPELESDEQILLDAAYHRLDTLPSLDLSPEELKTHYKSLLSFSGHVRHVKTLNRSRESR